MNPVSDHETSDGLPTVTKAMRKSPDICRVLIVEDDEAFCALCARYLNRSADSNYEIVPAALIELATALCKEQVFDCLIVDYRLPDGTGTDFLAALSDEITGQVPPAIVLTAGGGEEAAIQAVKVNATDFMTKADVSRTSLNRAVENAVVKSRLRESVAERNASLEQAYTELKKNSEEINQFYQTVSHEVKTPLMAMQEFLMLLNDGIAGPVSEPQQELLGYALQSCSQIAAHFEDLLDVTRMEVGKLSIATSLANPADLIKRCVVGAGGDARTHGVELIDRTSPTLPDLMIDPNRIMQVLGNLVANAIKFTEPGGQVILETDVQQENSLFIVRVTDTGCGLDPDLAERVFDRLYQIHHGVQDEAGKGGLGLGLSIARALANLHGGTVECVATSEKGTTFQMVLPLPDIRYGEGLDEMAHKAA